MRKVQLFISGEQVELFDDESISLTQTIQNVKDISLEAVRELNRLNVRVYSGVSGTVSQAILRYTKDRLKETNLGIDKSSSSSDQNELQYKDKTKDKKGVITTNTSVQF